MAVWRRDRKCKSGPAPGQVALGQLRSVDIQASEDRFILLGLSFQLRTPVVCHCYREAQRVVRIISARKADRKEQEAYWS